MRKIVIFGNSGSGKSTLAKKLCAAEDLSHLDLDSLAWQPTVPPERKPVEQCASEVFRFIDSNDGWVIEGCYSDLLELALPFSNKMIFMNLSVKACIENAKGRPWEPHKYKSKQAQDNNLDMLIDWISQYADRTDSLSQLAHNRLYEKYPGEKRVITKNQP